MREYIGGLADMSRENNIRIFQDTINLIEKDSELRRTQADADITLKNIFIYVPTPDGVQRIRSNTKLLRKQS